MGENHEVLVFADGHGTLVEFNPDTGEKTTLANLKPEKLAALKEHWANDDGGTFALLM
jgi:hypothetical protein